MIRLWRGLWRRIRPMQITIGIGTPYQHTMRADDMLALWRLKCYTQQHESERR